MAALHRHPRTIKINLIMIGGPDVGKSALVERFIMKHYTGEYSHEADKRHAINLTIDDQMIDLEILDFCTTGVEILPTRDQLTSIDSAVLVYAINDRKSYAFVQRVRDTLPAAMQIIMIANKSDLANQREVSKEAGSILSKYLNCTIFEVSAAEQTAQVVDSFKQACREVLASRSIHDIDEDFCLPPTCFIRGNTSRPVYE